jgi:Na(+)-translocating NADH:ubiquinone oxidoreductase F subunit
VAHDFSSALLDPPTSLDYSLTGENATRAIERGLAEADWYQSPVPRAAMRKLLERRDGPAIGDTILWFALILASGIATWYLWPSPWAALPYIVYAVLYSSTSDSRWHESGHGTAFKTDWLNNALYEIASFMVTRESVVWRWSHTRHHSDTIIVGRDPEIAVPRPPNIRAIIFSFFGLPNYPKYVKHIVMHSFGWMSADEKTFIPESEFPKIYRRARAYVAIYAIAIAIAIHSRSILPLLLVGFTDLFGKWLMVVYGLTQHAGLAENVLDHRLNCRTVYMNRLNRFLYWNMNYHVEHHMFPLVPYHALPALHEAVKSDMPRPYPSLVTAWREIIPAVWQQVKDPAYHVKRTLPEPKWNRREFGHRSDAEPNSQGWVEVCAARSLNRSDVLRFDHCRKTFALVRDEEGALYALDGICTHGNTHLADGLVKGDIIECPKHNGRFFLRDGSPARAPVCRGIATYPVEERQQRLYINISMAHGAGAREQKDIQLRVVSNRSVATFIKELTLEPLGANSGVEFTPGDYLQLEIPPFDCIRFRDFDIPEPYRSVWETQHVFDLVAHNSQSGRRNNYSLASNQELERVLRFNVRIATPPPGQDCPPGAGSAYVFSLKPGNIVSAIGPFGDFHIKPTQREMVYIGGGAGMAPLRAHLSHLFETEGTHRKVTFWYGARSRQELFYDEYFRELARKYPNFRFGMALSSSLPEDGWTGPTGFIHQVVRDEYLKKHTDPKAIEYYLCGPPLMIKACNKMLSDFEVPVSHIAYDEF